MSLSSLTSADAVRSAISEYDQIGRQAFLKKYGFSEARDYFLLHNGKLYDSKAIAGAAYGYEHPDKGPLPSSEFSGGEATVQPRLRSLGFEVVGGAGSAALTSEGALRILISLLGPPTSEPTRYLAAWRLRNGHEIALQLEQQSARLWLDRTPPEIQGLNVERYGPDDSRHSNLTSNAPSLAQPNVAFLCVAQHQAALRQLVDWYVGNEGSGETFGSLLTDLLSGFAGARSQPYREVKELWATAEALRAKIASLPSVASRPELLVKWSLGKGVWAKVPWIAILNRRVTTTTQRGLYVVFLVAEDLSRVYLTLNQGMTALVEELGQTGAAAEMRARAEAFRQRITELGDRGFELTNEIDLRTEGWRSKNYEVGTVAHLQILPDAPPTDTALDEQLEAVLSAYDKLVDDAPLADDRPCWFVGAVWGDDGDQTPRFLADGVWESGWESGPVLDEVKEIQAGDRIAIKSTFTTRNGLPFSNPGGESVSTMRIKAIGQVVENLGDGRRLKVAWEPEYAARDWFFYTNRATVWSVRPGPEPADQLIAFAFEGAAQHYEWFMRQPYWADRFASRAETAAHAYTIEMALEGLFLDRTEFERLLEIWRAKKNLVLQGAPGVGKSFIARRLAYALMQERADGRIGAVQFHQSYGYEDFVQGYRPTARGGFELRDGVFFRFCEMARSAPQQTFVFIIDEINRGNLSKIFGELMLLIEHDKRSEDWATELAYGGDGGGFYVPENVHLLGMMNTADRSLSMVDYALRRRFAFVPLEPKFTSERFRAHLAAAGVPAEVIGKIVNSMVALNAAICEDKVNLGPGFQIGHSFFTPGRSYRFAPGWFERIVDTEIRPLLEEYWFDDPTKAAHWRDRLLGGQ